ncbi:hypothetical protein [Nostoc sp.]
MKLKLDDYIGNWRIILTLFFRATASFHDDAASFIYHLSTDPL